LPLNVIVAPARTKAVYSAAETCSIFTHPWQDIAAFGGGPLAPTGIADIISIANIAPPTVLAIVVLIFNHSPFMFSVVL